MLRRTYPVFGIILVVFCMVACRHEGQTLSPWLSLSTVSGIVLPPKSNELSWDHIHLSLPNEGHLGIGNPIDEVVLNAEQKATEVSTTGKIVRLKFLAWNGLKYSVNIELPDARAAFIAHERLRIAFQKNFKILISAFGDDGACSELKKNVRGHDERPWTQNAELGRPVMINGFLSTDAVSRPIVAYTCTISRSEWRQIEAMAKLAETMIGQTTGSVSP